MLELVGLTRRYGDVVAMDDLTISIPAGEVFDLLGPNGAGKTTAMRTVLGISTPDSGRVLLDGVPIGLDERRRFGYLPEERGLYPGMKVGEQLVYLAELHGMSTADAKRSTQMWLERLRVAERAKDKLSALSLGNQQRVQLAAALVHGPDVLILDEPFSGLDPVATDEVGRVLDEVSAKGATVVFSSHQLDLVESRCASVAIIDKGRLVASGSVLDLTMSGRRRLVVELAGAKKNGWASGLEGVTVSESSASRVRLVLDDGVDPQVVLEAAMRSGTVTYFSFERRRLSEVFREAVTR
jgi:ABC-2 type transport system ATP-binding protein